jgi:hypothetical protein
LHDEIAFAEILVERGCAKWFNGSCAIAEVLVAKS